MSERVAITGAGVVTPIGIGADAFCEALRAGRSGVRRISAFPCEGFESQIAAEVADGSFDAVGFVNPPKLLKLMSRSAVFAVASAAMARRAAHLDAGEMDPARLGVSLGAGGMGVVDLDLLVGQAEAVLAAAGENGRTQWDIPAFGRVYRERTNPLSMLRGLPNLAAAHVAIQNNARGPNSTITTACTSGTQAIGEGMRIIQRGEADVVLAGGAEAM